MKIFPAIDLYGGKAVRLRKGDYDRMTVYSDDPASVAEDFKRRGAECIHLVDLEGAKTGETPNFETVCEILKVDLFSEIGGGIRSLATAEKYLSAGASRVILGTAAVNDLDFLREAVRLFGERIAVGADVKDGFIAVKGWLESSNLSLWDFTRQMQDLGVKTLICTDISRDGEMRGANLELYKRLTSELDMEIIASGGVTGLDEIKKLRDCGAAGAIIGKAYYEGLISLEDAISTAKG